MDDEDRLPIAEYVQRKGAVGVLAQIDVENGTPFGVLADRVHTSRNTVRDRVSEGDELGLFDRDVLTGDHGNTKRVIFTHRGRFLREQLEELGLIEAYQDFFDAHQVVQGLTEDLQENIWDSSIEDSRWPYSGEDVSGEYSASPGMEPGVDEEE